MLFNSLEFFLLVLITFGLYYIPIAKKIQVHILILASLFFYAWHYWELTSLLIASVFLNAFITDKLLSYPKSKIWVVFGVSLNLLILGIFKYAGLFGKTIFPNTDFANWLIMIPLPIGISFYTFQGISMVVDVYRGNTDVLQVMKSHSKTSVFFYIAFFPQLIAGPIVKAHDFLPQIEIKKWSNISWETVIHHLILGFFLKMVIADNLKDFTFWMEFPYFQSRSSITLLFYLLGYSAQIFADFQGYSLIAIGVAALFGYRLPINFNFPYIASSFSDFWRRWHISLSSFLKEYLYIPLGGNRKGKVRTYLNLMLTMILGGLWHGAAWSYAVWGAIHGVALALERFWDDWIITNNGTAAKKSIIRFVIVQFVVTFAWLTFKLPEFSHVLTYVKSIQNNFFIHDNYKDIGIIAAYIFPVFTYHFYAFCKENEVLKFPDWGKSLIYAVLLFLILLNSGSAGAFIYFQF